MVRSYGVPVFKVGMAYADCTCAKSPLQFYFSNLHWEQSGSDVCSLSYNLQYLRISLLLYLS